MTPQTWRVLATTTRIAKSRIQSSLRLKGSDRHSTSTMPPPPALTVLEDYAHLPDPSTLPPTVRLRSTDTTLTIFDSYPKAIFHFLILPRPSVLPASKPKGALKTLQSMLSTLSKEEALAVLTELQKEAAVVVKMIEDEQSKRYGPGCTWKVFVGFHAVPSMTHVHLHVISSDFVAPALKNKKHWNTFHPKLGFFLHLDDVLSWFDSSDADLAKKAELQPSKYEPLLKKDLECWKCDEKPKNIPKLKDHLQEHFDDEIKSLKRKAKK